MLQVAFIRQNVDFVKERLTVRNFKETGLVDEIVRLDDQRRKLQLILDLLALQLKRLARWHRRSPVGSFEIQFVTVSFPAVAFAVGAAPAFAQEPTQQTQQTQQTTQTTTTTSATASAHTSKK